MRHLLIVSLIMAAAVSGCATSQTASPEARAAQDAQKRAFALWLASRPPTDYTYYTPVHIERSPPAQSITTASPTHCTTREMLNSLQTDCY
jgi:hypothetical protein